MGTVFCVGDNTVWSPSIFVTKMFMSAVKELESDVGETSGFDGMASDYFEVDPQRLRHFIQRVLVRINLQNCSVALLLRGPMIHLLAMQAALFGEESLAGTKVENEWLESSLLLMRTHMTRMGQ